MNKNVSIVFVTAPSREVAETIAETIVNQGLAACVNIIPGITSVYLWEGKLQKDSEVLLIIKAKTENYSALESRIVSIHPYSVPEVIRVEVPEGFEKYLEWINSK